MSTHIYDLDSLRKAMDGGYPVKYLFFWGHQPGNAAQIGKECLSQWWPTSFVVDETNYASAEHFMMAEKARLFADESTRQKILVASTPALAKKLGREVAGFDETVWNAQRFEIVVRGNVAKFSQNEPLRTFLLGTNQRVLVEASPLDRIWGIGLAADHPQAENPEKWQGLNLLGFALMKVRDQL